MKTQERGRVNSIDDLIKYKDQLPVVAALNLLTEACFSNSVDKGFYDDFPPNDNEQAQLAYKSMKIALMHSELSEALEALRKPGGVDKHCPEFPNLDIELADVLIRVFDFCGANDINIGAAVFNKMAANAARPYKHGKKF